MASSPLLSRTRIFPTTTSTHEVLRNSASPTLARSQELTAHWCLYQRFRRLLGCLPQAELQALARMEDSKVKQKSHVCFALKLLFLLFS